MPGRFVPTPRFVSYGENKVVSNQSGSHNSAQIFQNDETYKNRVENTQGGSYNTLVATQYGAGSDTNSIVNKQFGSNSWARMTSAITPPSRK